MLLSSKKCSNHGKCYKHAGSVRKRSDWSVEWEVEKDTKRTITDFSYFPQLALQKDMVYIVMSMLDVSTLHAVLITCKAGRGWFDVKEAQTHLTIYKRHIYPNSPFLYAVELILQAAFQPPSNNEASPIFPLDAYTKKTHSLLKLPNIRNISVYNSALYGLSEILRNVRFNDITKLAIMEGNYMRIHCHIDTQSLRMQLLVLSESDFILSPTQLNKITFSCSTAVFHKSIVAKKNTRWPDTVFPNLKNLYTEPSGILLQSHLNFKMLERLCLTGCNMLRQEDWLVIEKSMKALRMLGLMIYDSSLSTSIQAPLECITPILPRLTHLYFHVGLYVFSQQPEEEDDDVNFLAYEGASFLDYLPYFTHLKVLHWPRFWRLSKEEDSFIHTKMPQLEKSTFSDPYMSLSAFFVSPIHEGEVMDEGLLASREAIRDIGRSANNTAFHHNPWKWEASLFSYDGKRHSNMNSDDDGYMSNGECVCG